VNTGDGGQDGLLVFVAEQLVAVLVLLDERHSPDSTYENKWFLEAGFGPCQTWNGEQIFTTQDEAIAWVKDQVQSDRGSGN
jgi:hypothetical protein